VKGGYKTCPYTSRHFDLPPPAAIVVLLCLYSHSYNQPNLPASYTISYKESVVTALHMRQKNQQRCATHNVSSVHRLRGPEQGWVGIRAEQSWYIDKGQQTTSSQA